MAGKNIAGTVIRIFSTELGPNAVIHLTKPVVKAGVTLHEVTMGGLKGFVMALQAAGLEFLEKGDAVYIEATGKVQPEGEGFSPMVTFSVEVIRKDNTYRGKTEDAKAPFLNAAFWDAE